MQAVEEDRNGNELQDKLSEDEEKLWDEVSIGSRRLVGPEGLF